MATAALVTKRPLSTTPLLKPAGCLATRYDSNSDPSRSRPRLRQLLPARTARTMGCDDPRTRGAGGCDIRPFQRRPERLRPEKTPRRCKNCWLTLCHPELVEGRAAPTRSHCQSFWDGIPRATL